MTKPDTGGRGEGRSSDLVMVEREVLERAHGHLCKIAGTEAWTHNNLDGWQVTPGALREYAESAAKELDRALQSVEGGVQGAAKQESCPESALRTETTSLPWRAECTDVYAHKPRIYGSDGRLVAEIGNAEDPLDHQDRWNADARTIVSAVNILESDWLVRLSASEAACYRWPEDTAEHRSMREAFMEGASHAAAAEIFDGTGPSDTQLTKTPSADHDAGNLRSLAEPNNTPRDSSESTTGGAS